MMRARLLAAALSTALSATLAATPALADRVLSIGGSITEIVFALGEGDRVVARDTTSSWPPEVTHLPDVGYVRRLSPEGVLSVAPDLILSEAGAGPVETLDLLREASIPFIEMPEGFTADAVEAKILAVAEALNVPQKGAELASQVRADFDAARTAAEAATEAPKRVLFVLSLAGGRMTAAGTNTSAAAIIELAGGVNAIEGVEGYKQMSEEAILAAQPDVILMMDRVGDHSVSDEDLFAHPALSTSPAAENDAVIRMNGLLLLGFGPRVGQAIRDLSEHLHSQMNEQGA